MGAASGRDAARRRASTPRSPRGPSRLKPLPQRRCATFTAKPRPPGHREDGQGLDHGVDLARGLCRDWSRGMRALRRLSRRQAAFRIKSPSSLPASPGATAGRCRCGRAPAGGAPGAAVGAGDRGRIPCSVPAAALVIPVERLGKYSLRPTRGPDGAQRSPGAASHRRAAPGRPR